MEKIDGGAMDSVVAGRSYLCQRMDTDLTVSSEALVEILSLEALGSGFYGNIAKVDVLHAGRKCYYALKTYKNLTDLEEAMKYYHLIKVAALPTWQTYRWIKGTSTILMTLGNKGNKLLFSPHNPSKDRDNLLASQLHQQLKPDIAFWSSIYADLIAAAEQEICLPWDAWMFEVEGKKLRAFIGDFDQISVWRRPFPPQDRLAANIYEFGGLLLECQVHMGLDRFDAYFDFLQECQKHEENGLLAQLDLPMIKASLPMTWNYHTNSSV